MSDRDDRQPGLCSTLWGVLRSPLPPGYGARPTFGWLLVVLFGVQLLSGVLLAMYYQPSPDRVDDSLRQIMTDVSWGWLIRGIHHWTSQGMVLLCALQFLRFLINGAYRGERAGHWVLGLSMAGTILVLALGGSLLVWDQTAYWRTVRLLNELEHLPVLGPTLASILRGGTEVTATTLSRAYAAHALLLPWLLAVLLGLHLWFLARRRTRTGGHR